MMRRRSAAALAFVLAMTSGAVAQDDSTCGKFKWSVARERGWFAAPKLVGTGAEAALGEGLDVTLVSSEAAGFVVPPERAPKPGSFGATLKLTLPKAGAYDVTVSAEAWIDVIQNGTSIKASDFSGQKNCPGVRKSVRFDLGAGPTMLQISNSETAKIMVATAPAE
jgi:hypothetical protein